MSPRVSTVLPSILSTSLAVASSPSLLQAAMSPAATTTGGPGGRSGAQPKARMVPRRATMTTVGASLLLALAAPSRSDTTADPAATILSNFLSNSDMAHLPPVDEP